MELKTKKFVMNRGSMVLALTATTAALAACGGGGDDAGTPATGATAEGVYAGTLGGSTSNAFQLLVLENGEYWTIYGTETATAFLVAGFVQGNAVSNSGSFTSTNARDFGVVPAAAGTISATYNAPAQTISGSVTIGTATVTFNGGPVSGSTYDYDAAASLSTIAGAWTLTDLDGVPISLNVAANGAFTATSAGCGITGTVTPRASGKNVFNVSMTFGAAPCALANQTATGIAVAAPEGGSTQLLVAAVDGTRTYGAAAVGTR
jgi:hypothetical protein